MSKVIRIDDDTYDFFVRMAADKQSETGEVVPIGKMVSETLKNFIITTKMLENQKAHHEKMLFALLKMSRIHLLQAEHFRYDFAEWTEYEEQVNKEDYSDDLFRVFGINILDKEILCTECGSRHNLMYCPSKDFFGGKAYYCPKKGDESKEIARHREDRLVVWNGREFREA